MRFPFIPALIAVLALAGCASRRLPPLHTGDPATKLADLMGSWEIDYKHTEDPRSELQYLYDITRSQLEQRQLQAQDGRDPRQGSRALRDLQGIIRLSTLASDEITHSTVLTISQSDGLVTIKRSNDYSLTCDFLAPVSELKIGQESCGFDDRGRLVFEAMLPEGLMVINRFSLSRDNGSEDDKRLYASLILSSDKLAKPFVLNRVYMSFPPGKSMYKCELTLEKKKTCWLGREPD
jgi:hypothetical protein